MLEGVKLLEKESAFFYNQISFTGTDSLEDPTGLVLALSYGRFVIFAANEMEIPSLDNFFSEF